MPRFAAVALIAVAAFTTAAHGQASAPEHFTLRGDRIAISNLAGVLRVEGGTGSVTTVDVTRGGADANQLRIETGSAGDENALRVVYPKGNVVYERLGRFSNTTVQVNSDGTINHGNGSWLGRDRVTIHGAGSGTRAYADVRVVIPRGMTLTVSLGAGDVAISNVDGKVNVDVAAASISAMHTHGDLTLDTGSGSVNLTDVQGSVNLDTGSGSVTLHDVRGDRIILDSGSGSVTASGVDARELTADVGSGTFRMSRMKVGKLNLQTGSGSTIVELTGDVDDVNIESGSGSVTLSVPATVGAAVNIETGSGSITTDFALQSLRRERGELHGSIGDGKGQIRIETGSGSVKVLKKVP